MGFAQTIFNFFGWWYGAGIKRFFAFFVALFDYVNNMFSIKSVLLTLFEPWKKIVGERRKGWDGFKDWLADNFVSRFVGLTMRTILIVVYLLTLGVFMLFFAISFCFWYLYPLIVFGSFFYIFLNG